MYQFHSQFAAKHYDGYRADFAKVELAFVLFQSGESIRQTARKVNVAPSTIQRWNERFYAVQV